LIVTHLSSATCHNLSGCLGDGRPGTAHFNRKPGSNGLRPETPGNVPSVPTFHYISEDERRCHPTHNSCCTQAASRKTREVAHPGAFLWNRSGSHLGTGPRKGSSSPTLSHLTRVGTVARAQVSSVPVSRVCPPFQTSHVILGQLLLFSLCLKKRTRSYALTKCSHSRFSLYRGLH
jgi:hypothetical protein